MINLYQHNSTNKSWKTDFIFSILIYLPLLFNFNSNVSFYLLLISFFFVFSKKKKFSSLYIYILIFILFYISYSYIISYLYFGYNFHSFFKFILLGVTLITQLNIAFSVNNYYSFFNGFALFFCLFIILNFSVILNINLNELQRIEIGVINPIWISRFSGFFILLIFVFKLYKSKTLQFLFSLILFSIIFLSGSKGPLLALLISFIYLNVRYIKVIALVLISFILLFTALPSDNLILFFFKKRFLTLNPNQVELTELIEGDRLDLFITTVTNFFNLNILKIFSGIGIGNSSFLYFNSLINERWYPHNSLLEILYESGPFFLLIFLYGLFIIIFKSVNKNISVFVLYFFINSFFSGDLPLNSYLFLFIFIYLRNKNLFLMNRNKLDYIK